jgi:RNA polymerase sigma-70 factor (ECF subfamily)
MRGHAPEDHAEWICRVLERFEAPLLLYAGRILGDAHRAQDVVQEVFLSLCREDRSQVEPRLAPWLYTVARNRALNERRRDRREAVGVEPQAAVASSDPAPQVEMRDAAVHVLRALDALPEEQQEAVRLKFQHGLRYRDIADVMRVTPGNVAVLVHRGVGALRARLGVAPRAHAPAPEGGTA